MLESNYELCWDEFVEWCSGNGVSLDHKEDWEPWFECWTAAINAKIEQQT